MCLLCGVLIACALILPLSVAAQTTGENGRPHGPAVSVVDAGDYYWADGSKVRVSRVKGELLVRLDPGTDLKQFAHQVTAAHGALAGFEPSVVLDDTTLGFVAQTERSANVDTSDARLRNTAGVAWVAPVFFNAQTGTRMWVTDQLVVALKPGAHPQDVLRGFFTYHPVLGTTDQYVATLAEGGSHTLNAANRLRSRPGVLWASPNFFQSFATWTGE
jgi:hypothetical protein